MGPPRCPTNTARGSVGCRHLTGAESRAWEVPVDTASLLLRYTIRQGVDRLGAPCIYTYSHLYIPKGVGRPISFPVRALRTDDRGSAAGAQGRHCPEQQASAATTELREEGARSVGPMRKIRNFEQLVSHGERDCRRVVLEVADRTLERLDSYERIKSIARMDGGVLHVGTRSWDLTKKRNVYLLGAGKACNHMAMAIDEVLGDFLTRGIAIVKISEDTDVFRNTDVFVGGHPLPNEEGYRASKKILELVGRAGPDDLFIVVISGGSSALMSCPRDGITLQDEIDATDVLLGSGAGIYEINAVRRHISALNGGMLAKKIRDVGAELIGIGISDAVGSPATGDIEEPFRSYKSTPIGPDMTTLDDARNAIFNHDVAHRLPERVVDYLMNAGPEAETPKAFPDNTYYLLNTLPDSCIYAKEACAGMGIAAMIVSSFLEGEGRDAGTFFASMAREIQTYGNPIEPPCVLLSCRRSHDAHPGWRRGHGAWRTEPGDDRELRHCSVEDAGCVSVVNRLRGHRRHHSGRRRPHGLDEPRGRGRTGHQSASGASRAFVFRGTRCNRRHGIHGQHRHQPV